MFILLHLSAADERKEIIINMDKVVCMRAGMAGGTILQYSPQNDFHVVEESISDIFARMRKE